MFHPIGPQPPNVYWRRRALLVGVVFAVLLLAVLTAVALRGKKDAAVLASGSRTPGPSASPTLASTATATATATASATVASSSPASSGVPVACLPSQLTIVATTNAPTYPVGAQPVVELRVTNKGPQPCVQGLGDRQIEFRVFNGAARVWGSHDCKVDPTPDLETLIVGTTVAKTVTWSGYSSQPACAGTRQVVGVGAYTLSVYLSGTEGTTSQFAINPAPTG